MPPLLIENRDRPFTQPTSSQRHPGPSTPHHHHESGVVVGCRGVVVGCRGVVVGCRNMVVGWRGVVVGCRGWGCFLVVNGRWNGRYEITVWINTMFCTLP